MRLEGIRQGAAGVRRTAQKNPMELLVEIIDADPTASTERLFQKYLAIVREDEDYFIPALRHGFMNMLSSLDRDRRNARAVGKPVPATRAPGTPTTDLKKRAAVVKQQVASIILMNLTLPNGKRLRDATFKECAAAGGWFARVAREGRPGQIVGAVLTEDRLRALLNAKEDAA